MVETFYQELVRVQSEGAPKPEEIWQGSVLALTTPPIAGSACGSAVATGVMVDIELDGFFRWDSNSAEVTRGSRARPRALASLTILGGSENHAAFLHPSPPALCPAAADAWSLPSAISGLPKSCQRVRGYAMCA